LESARAPATLSPQERGEGLGLTFSITNTHTIASRAESLYGSADHSSLAPLRSARTQREL